MRTNIDFRFAKKKLATKSRFVGKTILKDQMVLVHAFGVAAYMRGLLTIS